MIELPQITGLVGPGDLTTEEYREYFNIKTGGAYRIERPLALYYREGGTTHRVVDREGVVHAVPFNADVVLRWKNEGVNEGADPVSW